MASNLRNKDESLEKLQIPLSSLGITCAIDASETMGEGKTFGPGSCTSVPKSKKSVVECSFVNLGSITILSGRTTPVHAREHDTGRSSITLCYAGSPDYRDDETNTKIYPGEILAVPRNGGRISTGYLASINFPVDHGRISRTMRAMQCLDNSRMLQQGLAFQHTNTCPEKSRVKLVFEFFAYLNSLLTESKYIGKALCLDEQVYRLLALLIDAKAGQDARTTRRWRTLNTKWNNSLDELVDYIRTDSHRSLTLTDLEEQSHYSARRLQNLFRDKFDCTPMQFVRRQRLSTAMEKLQEGSWDDTVTTIGRDCGYRSTSNFSTDFHREFGVAPSMVLRASRHRGHQV